MTGSLEHCAIHCVHIACYFFLEEINSEDIALQKH